MLINESRREIKGDTIRGANLYKLQQNTVLHRISHTIGLLSLKSDDSCCFLPWVIMTLWSVLYPLCTYESDGLQFFFQTSLHSLFDFRITPAPPGVRRVLLLRWLERAVELLESWPQKKNKKGSEAKAR